MKLLEFGERSGVEPALHLGIQVAGAATAEGESLDGAMMLGDYLGGGGKGDERGGDGNAEELDADVEVERRGAPQGTPSAGEGLRAAAVLGGEEGDDGAEDGVGELADEIGVGLVAVATPCPLPGVSMGISLVGPGRRRHLDLSLFHGRRLAKAKRRIWPQANARQSCPPVTTRCLAPAPARSTRQGWSGGGRGSGWRGRVGRRPPRGFGRVGQAHTRIWGMEALCSRGGLPTCGAFFLVFEFGEILRERFSVHRVYI